MLDGPISLVIPSKGREAIDNVFIQIVCKISTESEREPLSNEEN